MSNDNEQLIQKGTWFEIHIDEQKIEVWIKYTLPWGQEGENINNDNTINKKWTMASNK
jgi:hypothetical protein